MKPEQWIINGEVGTSSKTIWAVMMGAVIKDKNAWWNYGVPHDPDDFRRCVALMILFPKWKSRLSEVATQFPEWVGFVREWNKLETMLNGWLKAKATYLVEKIKHPRIAERKRSKVYSDMYDFMRQLEDEGKLAAGWIQDGPGSWHRDNREAMEK